MQLWGVLALVFVLLIAVFAVQNAVPVDIHFLMWTFPGVSLVIVIFASALAGALIVVFLGILGFFKNRRKRAKEARGQQSAVAKTAGGGKGGTPEKEGGHAAGPGKTGPGA
ncbi:MAG: LapA family protein [Thermoanaerobacteraceae bacterium]|nr:LapA family protein [Thermoanaerobacteraceae bacterium]